MGQISVRRFRLITLGCKVNQYDGNVVGRLLRSAGWSDASPEEPATLVIVNTCCVTTEAMRKSRQAIRRTVRRSPEAAVAVVGCYSDYHADRIRQLLASLKIPNDKTLIVGHHQPLATVWEEFLRSLSEHRRDTLVTLEARQEESKAENHTFITSHRAPSATACHPQSIRTRRLAAV